MKVFSVDSCFQHFYFFISSGVARMIAQGLIKCAHLNGPLTVFGSLIPHLNLFTWKVYVNEQNKKNIH